MRDEDLTDSAAPCNMSANGEGVLNRRQTQGDTKPTLAFTEQIEAGADFPGEEQHVLHV